MNIETVAAAGEDVISHLILTMPEASDWSCQMFGMGQAMVLTPAKKDTPNWFWRKMQFLFFGNRWTKNDGH